MEIGTNMWCMHVCVGRGREIWGGGCMLTCFGFRAVVRRRLEQRKTLELSKREYFITGKNRREV